MIVAVNYASKGSFRQQLWVSILDYLYWISGGIITFLCGNHGFPQMMGILVCILLHLWRKNMMLTIAGGTILYMVL